MIFCDSDHGIYDVSVVDLESKPNCMSKKGKHDSTRNYDAKFQRLMERSSMETILSTDIYIPMSQMVVVLTLITAVLIFGHIKLSLFIGYFAILYWSNIWDLSLFFTESSVLKMSGPAFLLTGFMIIIVLISMISLIFYQE